MDKKKFIKIFRRLFVPYFESKGFVSVQESVFKRKSDDVEHIVTFAPRKSGDGDVCMSAGFGIRIPKVESFEKNLSTLGMPLYLLRPGREYYLWSFGGKEDVEAAEPAIISDIETYGLPFLNRFSDSESVYLALKSEDPDNWFMCSSDSRDALLVAFIFLRSGKAEALKTGENLLKKYENRMEKYSQALRGVISKIREK